MKLAASNICWPADDFDGFLRTLAAEGAEGVELAPSRLWPEDLVDFLAHVRRDILINWKELCVM